MRFLAIFFILCLFSKPLFALVGNQHSQSSFNLFDPSLNPNSQNNVNVNASPLMLLKAQQIVSPGAYFNGFQKSIQSVADELHQNKLPHFIHAKKRVTNNKINLHKIGLQVSSYDFYIASNKLCDGESHIYKFNNGKFSFKLRLQEIKDTDTPYLNWQSWSDVDNDPFDTMKYEKCIFNDGGYLVAAWKLLVMDEELPYEVIIDNFGSELRRSKMYADVASGVVGAYERNAVEDAGAVSTFGLDFEEAAPGLRKMKNIFLESDPSPEDQMYANDDNYEFVFDPDTEPDEFAEASAFLHANLQLSYFFENEYTWVGDRPLQIRVNHLFNNNDRDNAAYFPVFSKSLPTIFIGSGSGVILQDLALDRDVISHELGHHVVFRSITDFQEPSVTLHEAYADFFSYDSTDNSCLGESICVGDDAVTEGGSCWVGASSPVHSTKCLRTAESDLTLQEAESLGLPFHFLSQVLSGMLWDMRRATTSTSVADIEGLGLDKEIVRKLAHNSIDFLPSQAGYLEFVLGLMEADLALTDGANLALIFRAAQNRGLGPYLTDIDCNVNTCDRDSLPILDKNSTTIASISQKDVNTFEPSCGGTSSEAGVGGQSAFFLIFLPMLLGFRRPRRK